MLYTLGYTESHFWIFLNLFVNFNILSQFCNADELLQSSLGFKLSKLRKSHLSGYEIVCLKIILQYSIGTGTKNTYFVNSKIAYWQNTCTQKSYSRKTDFLPPKVPIFLLLFSNFFRWILSLSFVDFIGTYCK